MKTPPWTFKLIGRIGHVEHWIDENAGLATATIREVQSQHERWWPVVGGMFGSDWQRAEAAAVAWSENVIAARQRRW